MAQFVTIISVVIDVMEILVVYAIHEYDIWGCPYETSIFSTSRLCGIHEIDNIVASIQQVTNFEFAKLGRLGPLW